MSSFEEQLDLLKEKYPTNFKKYMTSYICYSIKKETNNDQILEIIIGRYQIEDIINNYQFTNKENKELYNQMKTEYNQMIKNTEQLDYLGKYITPLYTTTQQKKQGITLTPEPLVKQTVKNTIQTQYQSNTIPEDIHALHVLDPACGTGRFLLHTLQQEYNLQYKTTKNKPQDHHLYYIITKLKGFDTDKLMCLTTTLQLYMLYNHLLPENTDESTPILEIYNENFLHTNHYGTPQIIIGNPPYIRARKNQTKQEKQYYKKQFTIYTGYNDIYMYFIEKALQILAPNGILTYITSATFIKKDFGKKLRKHILNYQINKITTLNDNTFKQRDLNEGIIIIQIQNTTPSPNHQITYNHKTKIPQNTLTQEKWILQPTPILKLYHKIITQSYPIKKIQEITINRGTHINNTETFIIPETLATQIQKEIKQHPQDKQQPLLQPTLRGKDIQLHYHTPIHEYILSIPEPINLQHYPTLQKHLQKHKPQTQKNPNWYITKHNPTLQTDNQPKIIIPYISKHINAIYTTENIQTIHSTNIITIENNNTQLLQALTPIITSNIQRFIQTIELPHMKSKSLELITQRALELKIPYNLPLHLEELATLTQKATKHNHKEIQDQTNIRLYNMYNLTENEIQLLEKTIENFK